MKTIFISSILPFIIFVSALPAVSQDYVVTSKGDTLRGSIKIFNTGPDKKIQINSADKKKTYLPIFQIRSFVLKNETFHPVKGNSGYEFMKLIKDGYLALYGYQTPNQLDYSGMFLTKKDGTSLEVPNLSFKKALQKFLNECDGTAAKIDQGAYGRKDLMLIVDDFNNCINEKTNRYAQIQPAKVDAQSGPWKALEEVVSASADYAGKADALEMIREIQKKLEAGEKVPNFLIEGLKSTLKDTGVDAELNTALQEIK